MIFMFITLFQSQFAFQGEGRICIRQQLGHILYQSADAPGFCAETESEAYMVSYEMYQTVH